MAWQPVGIRSNEQQAIVSQLKPGFSLDLKIVCLIFFVGGQLNTPD